MINQNWISNFKKRIRQNFSLIIQKFVVFVLIMTPADTGRKLNVHRTFRRRPRRFLKVLCRFNLRPVSTGTQISGRWQKADLPDSDPG